MEYDPALGMVYSSPLYPVLCCAGFSQDHPWRARCGAVVQRDSPGMQKLCPAMHGGLLRWDNVPPSCERYVGGVQQSLPRVVKVYQRLVTG